MPVDAKYHRDYYHSKRRAELLTFMGGKCVTCSSTQDLQFDHIDPNLKSFDIRSNMTLSNLEIQEELKKCQLLCKTCHEAKTAKENSGFSHGTRYGWLKIKCPCQECQDSKKSFYEERNAKRRQGDARGPYEKDPAHGTTRKYSRGCRCSECRMANAAKAKRLRDMGK